MSKVGRTQNGAPSEGSDGKMMGLDRNTLIIVVVVIIVGLILVWLYWRNRDTKKSEPNPHVIINNGCNTDAECPTGKHCKVSNGMCVECTGDAQCEQNENGPRCNMASNNCVQCTGHGDCFEGQQCIANVCSPMDL